MTGFSFNVGQMWAVQIQPPFRATLLLSQKAELEAKDLLGTAHPAAGRLTVARHLERLAASGRFVDKGQALMVLSARNVMSNPRCLGFVRGETAVPVGVKGDPVGPKRPFFAMAGRTGGSVVIEVLDMRNPPPPDWLWFITGIPVLVDGESDERIFHRIVAEAADHSHVWQLPRGDHPLATDESRRHWSTLHEIFFAHADADPDVAAAALLRYAARVGLKREEGVVHNVLGLDADGRLLQLAAAGRLEHLGRWLKGQGATHALCVDNSGSTAVQYRPPGGAGDPLINLFAAPNHRPSGTAFLLVELSSGMYGRLPDISPTMASDDKAPLPLDIHLWQDDVPLRREFERILAAHFTGADRDRIGRALALAEQVHAGMKRHGATNAPYIVHPLRIFCRLTERFGIRCPNLLCAAILHDVIEDVSKSGFGMSAETLREKVRVEFGSETARLVCSLTRGPDESRNGGCDTPESPYLQRVRAAGDDAITLKISDKIDNLLDARQLDDTEKIKRYLLETLIAYFALAKRVSDPGRRRMLVDDLLAAAAAHNPALVESAVDAAVLCNPRNRDWIGWDGVRLFSEVVPPTELASRTARRWGQIIAAAVHSARAGRGDERLLGFMDRFGLPPTLLPLGPGADAEIGRKPWLRVIREMAEFARIVGDASATPRWLVSSIEDPEALLLTIHSLVFRVMSWRFAQWHDDAGAAIATNQQFAHLRATPDELLRWHALLEILLINRNAVYRYASGTGSRKRVCELSAQAMNALRSPAALWSIRLLSEYLDLYGRGRTDAGALEFQRLWGYLEQSSFSEPDASLVCLQTNEIWMSIPRPHQLDVQSLVEARALFNEFGAAATATDPPSTPIFARLLRILAHAPPSLIPGRCWLVFDVEELRKRWNQFSRDIAALPDSLDLAELPRFGLIAQHEMVAGRALLIVRPAPRYTFADRLPEASEEDICELEAKGFSSCAVFDRMLLDRFVPESREAPPIWIPRVFRVLDTIESLDSAHVQKIIISFDRQEHPSELVTWLPLPSDGQAHRQPSRKEFLARFIALQIYNAAAIARLAGAMLHCAPSTDPNCLRDGELMELVAEQERRLNLRPQLSSYCEQFNFNPFQIIPGTPPAREEIDFRISDMRAERQFALGLDIGGTDTKFCFWRDGQISADNVEWIDLAEVSDSRAGVGKVSTPNPPNPNAPFTVDEFCGELIRLLDRAVPAGVPWRKLDAIGLSWAGGVRENRIVAVSGVLGRMAEPGSKDGRKPYSAGSPVNEIHSVNLLARFRAMIPQPVKARLAMALENDGSAEALGNNAARLIRAHGYAHEKQSTVVLKLGTSLAGGRVTPNGTVGDDIAEYSKAHLNMNAPPYLMRDFVSSIAIRSAARTMKLNPHDPEPIFGEYGELNRVEPKGSAGDSLLPARVEAEDIGRLLGLWAAVDTERVFLDECVASLIHGEAVDADPHIERLTAALIRGGCVRELESLVLGLGGLMRRNILRWSDADVNALRRIAGRNVDHVRNGKSAQTNDNDLQRLLGISRLRWLVTGQPTDPNDPGVDPIPCDDRWNRDLARKAIGAVLLMSRIGLHIAHAVAQLFNSYGKKTFDRVILGGGVLSGLTGEVIEAQTRSFLMCLYDKLYTRDESDLDKPLRGAAVARATQVVDPNALGPVGAAISALRVLKIESAMRLDDTVAAKVSMLDVGSEIGADLVRQDPHFDELGVFSDSEILSCLQRQMSEGYLLPLARDATRFQKTR